MPKQRTMFHDRVYYKSEQEGISVRTRAAMLGKSVSTYIRDLIVIDLYQAQLRGIIDTSENNARIKELVKMGRNDEAAELLSAQGRMPLTAEQIAASAARLNEPTAEEKELERKQLLESFKQTEEGTIAAFEPDNFQPIPIEEMEFDTVEEKPQKPQKQPEQMTWKDVEKIQNEIEDE